METKVYFENIRETIFEHLDNSKYNIFVAVAWITDTLLWEKLCEKALTTHVQVLLVDDEINRNSKIDFNKFLNNGGQLYFGEHHHKFCIIDLKTLISGSYNWTYYANNRINGENIEVKTYAHDLCEQYADVFKKLLDDSKPEKKSLQKKSFVSDKQTKPILNLKKYAPNLPNLIPFRKGKKWGFCDKDKNIIIPIEYEDVSLFKNNLALVRLNGKYGYINQENQEIIKIKYGYLNDFSDGLCIARLESSWGPYGFLNEEGKVKIDFKYNIDYNNNINSFSCGLALMKKNNLIGFIDKNENLKINFKYEDGFSFSEGLAAVKFNGKWGFIDKNGTCIIPFKFDKANSFCNGLAWVLENDKKSFINNSGDYIMQFKYYDSIYNLSDGLIGVGQNGKFGFIDINHKHVIAKKYDYINSFSEGLACVKLQDKWHVINKDDVSKLSWSFKTGYTNIKFEESLAKIFIIESNNYGYIDTLGNKYF